MGLADVSFHFASLQSDCLNNISNAEKRGKRQVLIRPSSKVIVRFLSVIQKHGKPHISYFRQRCAMAICNAYCACETRQRVLIENRTAS